MGGESSRRWSVEDDSFVAVTLTESFRKRLEKSGKNDVSGELVEFKPNVLEGTKGTLSAHLFKNTQQKLQGWTNLTFWCFILGIAFLFLNRTEITILQLQKWINNSLIPVDEGNTLFLYHFLP